MIVHNLDPDVIRWGLHQLIDVCALSNSGSCSSVTQYDREANHVAYARECYNSTLHMNTVENDAAIARALQDELSRIAAAEASGLENREQQSVIAQDWHGPRGSCDNSEYANNQRSEDDRAKHKIDADCSKNEQSDSSKNKIDEDGTLIHVLSSSTGEESLNMEEPSLSVEIEDESAFDGELGKRLNEMVPIPHVPKINGEIPSEDMEISDHQRLLDRLKVYDLVENKVQGDGNCQFSSLSDQLYHSPQHHKIVRELVINQLKAHPEMYEGYVPMAYGDYLKKMSKSGEWGDHVTLQAAADVYGVRIFMITSFKDTCYIEILPHTQKTAHIIFLSFWAEVHYNSIYPEGELPPSESKKRKKWWIL